MLLLLLSLIPLSHTAAVNNGTNSSVPVFLQEPDPLYYMIRGKPVTITCRAAPAVQINIKCGGQWVSPHLLVNTQGVDPATGVQYFQASVDLDKDEVTDDMLCECHAWNSGSIPPVNAKSKSGKITIAKLPKRFEQEPIGSNVEVGSTVRLQCLPPEGVPTPTVFWLRNGEIIDADKDINFIISHEGSLIINQARLADSANYTCGAQNIAGRRLSESAPLTVYLNGGWSSWSRWSECGGSDCLRSFQRRTRQCSNPTPVNGGAPCIGDFVQKLSCASQCKVDGSWSTWSSWSSCSVECRQHRRRLCDNPPPSNNGLYCNGTDLDSSNCTGGHCVVVSGMKDGGAVMYAGLAVAIVVFFIVIGFIIMLFRRGKSTTAGMNSSKASCKLSRVSDMLLRPDLTKATPIAPSGRTCSSSSSCSSYDAESPNSYASCSNSKAAMRDSTQRLLPCHNADISLPLLQYQTSCLQSTNQKRCTSMTSQLPASLDPETMVWSVVGSQGGRLTLPESGISLLIPEGAISEGETSEIYLGVSREDRDRPKLTDSQTVISAVVVCGPASLRLNKSCILTVPHCASVKHGLWKISGYSSDTSSEPPSWNRVCTMGEEVANSSAILQMDFNQCHLVTDQLARFTLIGQPFADQTAAVKVLRLAVFAPQTPSPMDYSLRVYCVEDTKDAMEDITAFNQKTPREYPLIKSRNTGVLRVERRLGGVLLEKPKQLLFQHTGSNLCLAIEDLGCGWRCKMAANYQEIPFRHIWSGTQNGLHCSFALEQYLQPTDSLTCDIHVYQTGLLHNRQILRITHDLNNVSCISTISGTQSTLPRSDMKKSSTVTSGFVQLESTDQAFRLYGDLKRRLCEMLDQPNNQSADWRLLACQLSLNRYINYFSTKLSPTEEILNLWEARHREESALSDLSHSLRVMGRPDAAALIDQQLSGAHIV